MTWLGNIINKVLVRKLLMILVFYNGLNKSIIINIELRGLQVRHVIGIGLLKFKFYIINFRIIKKNYFLYPSNIDIGK